MFVDFFIRRPVFATVCALLIILAGAISIPSLPIAQFPDLAPPQVVVTSFYIGANAQAVESAVTIPLEQEINGVEGMRYITSTSGNDGTQHHHRDLRRYARRRPGGGGRAEPREPARWAACPNEVKKTGIIDHQGSPAASCSARAFYPDNGAYDSLFLSNYADVYVKDALKRVPRRGRRAHFRRAQVLHAAVAGSGALARRGLTATDVVQRAAASRTCRWPRARWASRRRDDGQAYQISVRARRAG